MKGTSRPRAGSGPARLGAIPTSGPNTAVNMVSFLGNIFYSFEELRVGTADDTCCVWARPTLPVGCRATGRSGGISVLQADMLARNRASHSGIGPRPPAPALITFSAWAIAGVNIELKVDLCTLPGLKLKCA